MPALPFDAGQDVTVGGGGGLRSAGPGALTPTIDTPCVVRLFDDQELAAFAVRDDSDWVVAPPSQKQQRPGLLRGIYFPCTAGVRTVFSVMCKYTPLTAPRPRVIITANPAVGIPDDVFVDAPVGTDWVLIESPEFTPTADGVVEVQRELLQAGTVNWDQIVVIV